MNLYLVARLGSNSGTLSGLENSLEPVEVECFLQHGGNSLYP